MSAECAAERLMDALPDDFEPDTFGPTEDLRTGGFFFGMERNGRQYEVLVMEVH